MDYVIVHQPTWKPYRGNAYGFKIYKTEAAAKAQFTKLTKTKNAKKRLDPTEWEVMSFEYFRDNEPFVTVKNMMSGKDVVLRQSDVGGCCDPSTETYWSM
jgi:hypothetical protein